MPLSVMLPVLLSAALHASWNAMIKSGTDRYLDTFLIVAGSGTAAACCIPFLPLPDRASWTYLGASAFIHVGYFTLVALAYHRGDMSLVYPLTRGPVPALTALAALATLGEDPSAGGWMGILLVSGGVLLLAVDSRRTGAVRIAPVAIPLANAAVVVTYTLVDGVGARLSGNAFAYTSWMTLCTVALFAPIVVAVRGRAALRHLGGGRGKAMVGGTCTLASFCLALWAMTLAPIALVSAIRETSIVFGTAIAVVVLGEHASKLRLLSIAIVTAGAITIKLL